MLFKNSSSTTRKRCLILFLCIAVLLVAHIISYIYLYTDHQDKEEFFFRKLDFGEEKNVPSIFSTLLYVIISFLLFSIAASTLKIKKNVFFWVSLGVLFLFLGADELLRIHEKIGSFTATKIETEGLFYHSWVIPYGIALLLLFFLYVKPLFKLPRPTLISFIVSGVVFIAGAVGLEMIGGWYTDHYISDVATMHLSIPIFLMYTVEELLEMIGLSLFICALLRFKEQHTQINYLDTST